MRIFNLNGLKNAQNSVKAVDILSKGAKTAADTTTNKPAIGALDALAFSGNSMIGKIIRNNTPSEVKSLLGSVQRQTDDAKKIISKIAKEAQDKYQELCTLYKKGNEMTPEGKVLRQLSEDINGARWMDEYDINGKKISTTFFMNGKPAQYEQLDTSTNARKIIDYSTDGKLSIYKDGYKRLNDGTSKTAREFISTSDKFCTYREGVEITPNSTVKTAKHIDFVDSKPSWYEEGRVYYKNGASTRAKKVGFKDGKPIDITLGYNSADEKAGQCYKLADNSWKQIK